MYFSIEKNKNKKTEKHPDYNIKMNNYDPNAKYKTDFVGACWTRTNNDGSEWLSCSMEPEKIPAAVMHKCFGGQAQEVLTQENGQQELPEMPAPQDTTNYDSQVPF